MSCSDCRQVNAHSKIKIEEGARKAVFANPRKEHFHTTRVDGCLVKNSIAADFVVSKPNVGDVIVELKGTDVEHGAEQVIETASFLSKCTKKRGPLAGLIVCRQYPRVNTKLQRLSSLFTKRFKGPLHVVAKNVEFAFERVLSFAGPY